MHGAFENVAPHGPCIIHLATVSWAKELLVITPHEKVTGSVNVRKQSTFNASVNRGEGNRLFVNTQHERR
jgi:hypothetical protein